MRVLVLALCGFVLLSGVPSRAEEAVSQAVYISEMEDVPLMQGLMENAGEGMVFDQPEGRVVQAVATGEGLSAASVATYYAALLPQLGWEVSSPENPLAFTRGDERLVIDMAADEAGVLSVSFTLSPR